MTHFVIWLLTQHARRDDVGSLARFAAQSDVFPRRGAHLWRLLEWAGEDKQLRRVIKDAHREWRSKKPVTNTSQREAQ